MTHPGQLCCWHETTVVPADILAVTVCHCCRPGCKDVLIEQGAVGGEEKTHGYLEAHASERPMLTVRARRPKG